MLLILAIILLIFLPSPWGLILCVALVIGFIGEVIFWQGKVRNRRAAVGSQTLVGRTGEVVSDCTPTGQVRIEGEIWAAHCASGAAAGQPVRVVSVDELNLVVEPK
jgi:membrane-bound serine protease (ClpP class)